MITVLGSSGFVGSQVVKDLEAKKLEFHAPERNEKLIDKNLGDVIYCIGLTSDFRAKPHETITAHVSYLNELIQNNTFTSLTYLSSTRMYIHNTQTQEDASISINPKDPFDLYNSSKLTGELLALNCGRKNVKVARLSNVFGADFNSDNFVTSITKDALINNKVVLRTTPQSSKDYISVLDVSEMLIRLAKVEKSGIYNVAAGYNVTNKAILDKLQALTDCEIEFDAKAETIIFPEITNAKLVAEINFKPERTLLSELDSFVTQFKAHLKK